MNKKRLRNYLALCLAAVMLFPAAAVYAQNTTDEDIAKTKFSVSKDSVKIQDVQKFIKNDISVGNELDETTADTDLKVELKKADGNDSNRSALTKAGATRSGEFWGNTTVAFNPNNTRATSDIDIIWNRYVNGDFNPDHDILNTGAGSLFAKYFTSVNPNTQSEYTDKLNEGRVNDYMGYFMPHQYYAFTINAEDTMTFFNSSKVRTLVVSEYNELLLDTGYDNNGNTLSPKAFYPAIRYNQTTAYAFNSSKTVFYLTVPAGHYYVIHLPYGNYPVSADNVDTLDNTYHYAFYVGGALPILKSYNSPINLGSVYWYSRTDYTDESPKAVLNVSGDASIAPLFIVKTLGIRSLSTQGRANLRSLWYYFKMPSSSYQSSFLERGSYLEPASSVIPRSTFIGRWEFFYEVQWDSSISTPPGLRTFSASGQLYIDYFVPFGSGL